MLILQYAFCVASDSAAKAKHTSEADPLNRRVAKLFQAGKYQEAIPVAEQLLEISEKALDPEHPDTASSLDNLADL